VDYFQSWSDSDEAELAALLKASPARFILSTWHHNDFRTNESLARFWSDFHVVTREHFYHAGAKEKNRRPMIEALAMNFPPKKVLIDELVLDEGYSIETQEMPVFTGFQSELEI
jgi:DNA adenine methylase